VVTLSEPAPIMGVGNERIAVAPACSIDLDAVERHAIRAALPAATEKIDFVSRPGDPAEDLMKVNFCAARLRILPILPVEDEYPH
jgi:hypothetical protein